MTHLYPISLSDLLHRKFGCSSRMLTTFMLGAFLFGRKRSSAQSTDRCCYILFKYVHAKILFRSRFIDESSGGKKDPAPRCTRRASALTVFFRFRNAASLAVFGQLRLCSELLSTGCALMFSRLFCVHKLSPFEASAVLPELVCFGSVFFPIESVA